MIRKPDKPARNRMIHIRLDDKTHRDLKICAVRHDTTVQNVVENLIREKLAKERSRKE